MRLWKSQANQPNLHPSDSLGNLSSRSLISSRFCITAISLVSMFVFGGFCYVVPAFSRGEIRLEGLGIRFEARLDSHPNQDKVLPPADRK
jgi:hypothetical protein